jgi:hypothetical protein
VNENDDLKTIATTGPTAAATTAATPPSSHAPRRSGLRSAAAAAPATATSADAPAMSPTVPSPLSSPISFTPPIPPVTSADRTTGSKASRGTTSPPSSRRKTKPPPSGASTRGAAPPFAQPPLDPFGPREPRGAGHGGYGAPVSSGPLSPSPGTAWPAGGPRRGETPAAFRARLLEEATIVRDLWFSAQLHAMIGLPQVSPEAVRVFINSFMRDAGEPVDPVEKMLLEELVLTHFGAIQKHVRAAAADAPEHVRLLTAAATQLTHAVRQTSLTLGEYRGRNRAPAGAAAPQQQGASPAGAKSAGPPPDAPPGRGGAAAAADEPGDGPGPARGGSHR